jgi:hypothetical protein
LQPTHKDFILIAQIIAEQMIFRTMGTLGLLPLENHN